jgi:hypothetical protein
MDHTGTTTTTAIIIDTTTDESCRQYEIQLCGLL